MPLFLTKPTYFSIRKKQAKVEVGECGFDETVGAPMHTFSLFMVTAWVLPPPINSPLATAPITKAEVTDFKASESHHERCCMWKLASSPDRPCDMVVSQNRGTPI